MRTFQAVRLFRGLTVSENVEIGYVAQGLGRREARRRALAMLGELRLDREGASAAAGLSYGEERRIGLARALAVNPRFLLLDEPAAGLAAAEADELRHLIVDIRSKYDCGVLVIEHNMALVMNLCERIHVLDSGRTIATGHAGGNPRRCRRSPRLSRPRRGCNEPRARRSSPSPGSSCATAPSPPSAKSTCRSTKARS